MPLPLLCDALPLEIVWLLFDKLFLRRSEGSNGSLSQLTFKLEAVFIVVPTLGVGLKVRQVSTSHEGQTVEHSLL